MKKLTVILALAAMFLFSLSTTSVPAQPVDYCEGNFDNDQDQDGSDAFVFKQDFGRSSLLDPCPMIACETAEQLEMRIVQLETQLAQVTELLANVTRGTVQGQDTIRFSGMNVQIVSGSGNTSGTVNGRGNLIIGYNETRNDGNDDRTGSHNIVVGSRHNYSSYGGLVAGRWNTVSAPYASVSGGNNNTSSSQASSVCGGANNTASSQSASIGGGRYNEASGEYSFVGGGGSDTAYQGNKAFAHYSAVLGGGWNIAGDQFLSDHTIGERSSVSGGWDNNASGTYAGVSGGMRNIASGNASSVTGGRNNKASGDYSFVGGGGYNGIEYRNEAFGHYSAILGGRMNVAGDSTLTDHTVGQASTVSGGVGNDASGEDSSVSGGSYRDAPGDNNWAAGGLFESW